MKALFFEDLKGKVAVMTGGTGVIGRSAAQALAAAGVRLALAGRDSRRAEAIAGEIASQTGGQLIGLGLNVLDRSSLEEARRVVHERWGPVQLLINGAGGNRPGATAQDERMTGADPSERGRSFFGLDLGAFDEVFRLNVMGTVLPTQVFAQDMVGTGGVVVNLSSMASLRPLTKVAAYAASKAAVNNLTQWLSVHLAPQKIRVNALAPGFFLTEQNRFLLTDEKTGEPTARTRKILAATPLGRLGEVDELQGALLFLLSDLSRFVTGTVVAVDGGFSAYSGV
ncbi:MAG: SDR family oxidoreductase [Spirochaetales bacterium]|nr:SDR family oxidoreductase [Spirochaetales bacterium]